MVRFFLAIIFVLSLSSGFSTPAYADDPNQSANRTFTEAIQLIRRAGTTYDTREAVRLLRLSDKLLKKIVADFPESTIAVQLVTNQFIGDFDVMDFRNRIRSLSCERGNYVEDFLSEHGVVTATGPATEACFLYRMETLLTPYEHPITQARWDWISLGVVYHLFGQTERSREIILPFLNAVLMKSKSNDSQDSLLFTARAMMLTGEDEQAVKITQRISDCAARLYTMADMLKLAQWDNKDMEAKTLADDIKTFTEDNQCNWQKGLVVQSLSYTGRGEDAKKMYDVLLQEQFSNVKLEDRAENTPPELALAASVVGDPANAVAILKVVADANPWVVAQAMSELATRGEYEIAENYINELKENARKAEGLVALIEVANRNGDKKRTGHFMSMLSGLRTSPSQPVDQVMVLASKARAEKIVYNDDRWRETMKTALNTADLVEEAKRAQVALPLIATLGFIKSGRPILD